MHLVAGTVLWVIVVTVLVALAGYVIDRGTARQEREK